MAGRQNVTAKQSVRAWFRKDVPGRTTALAHEMQSLNPPGARGIAAHASGVALVP
jgi:hypothetical protein